MSNADYTLAQLAEPYSTDFARRDPLGLRVRDGSPKQIIERLSEREDYRRDGSLKRRTRTAERVINW